MLRNVVTRCASYCTLLYATLLYATVHSATLRCAKLLCTTPRLATLRYTTLRLLRYATLRYAAPFYATLLYGTHAALCCATPRYAALRDAAPHCCTRRCGMQRYATVLNTEGGVREERGQKGGLIPSATAVRACHRPIDRKSIDLRLEGARTNSSRGHSPPRPAPACHPQLHPLWPPHSPFSESPRYWYTGPPQGPGHPRALSTSPRHQYTRLREPAPRAHPPPARPWPAAPPPGPSLWGACITGAPAGRPPGPPWARPLSESSHHRYTRLGEPASPVHPPRPRPPRSPGFGPRACSGTVSEHAFFGKKACSGAKRHHRYNRLDRYKNRT